MHVHGAPSSALAQISPLVVPKYTPTGSAVATVIAWRFTVNHARSGRPVPSRVHDSPASRGTEAAGGPSGLVRGPQSGPPLRENPPVSGSHGVSPCRAPMLPTSSR